GGAFLCTPNRLSRRSLGEGGSTARRNAACRKRTSPRGSGEVDGQARKGSGRARGNTRVNRTSPEQSAQRVVRCAGRFVSASLARAENQAVGDREIDGQAGRGSR